MRCDTITLDGKPHILYSCNTIVVGSGAAGLNAADRLYAYGQTDIAIVTEGLDMGTSLNTGSDKQTYYKLTLSGNQPDSVLDMANTLFSGGAMDGDIAMCEAAMSAQCFYRLCELGVPFPHETYGQYTGYKTDHDPRQRATSAGPLTSRYMTQFLLKSVQNKGIRIFDGLQVISILRDGNTAIGLTAIDKTSSDRSLTIFNCTNIIYATGGPAGLYEKSVYPMSQTGATGIAFQAGIAGINLTEWQYGISSTLFRWNLSGTYQQVLPRYISTDTSGTDEHEFLSDYISGSDELLQSVFLKGYQWPFDPRKLTGSSRVDLAVYNEIEIKGRKVYVDYSRNPSQLDCDLSILSGECAEYLRKSGALFGTPVERLMKMNPLAYELYKNNGIDLMKDRLEIAVCAQHNNGGLEVNNRWETSLGHFFAVGEVAGTHGVYRPGGSALNSGQAGSTRAAQYIAAKYTAPPLSADAFAELAGKQIHKQQAIIEQLVTNTGGESVRSISSQMRALMSRHASIKRSAEGLQEIISFASASLGGGACAIKLASPDELPQALKLLDLLTAQLVYATAMYEYISHGGASRGSYLVEMHGELFFADDTLADKVQQIHYDCDGKIVVKWRGVRPIPVNDDWFENVWADYRDGKHLL